MKAKQKKNCPKTKSLEVTFEGSALGQLIKLQRCFKLQNKGEVIKFGICMLARIMESQKNPLKFMRKFIRLTANKK